MEAYLDHFGKAYADHQLVVVLANAPSRRAVEIELPEKVELLLLPTCSPELDPVERWFQEFRRCVFQQGLRGHRLAAGDSH